MSDAAILYRIEDILAANKHKCTPDSALPQNKYHIQDLLNGNYQ
jgi:hypothetical protein